MSIQCACRERHADREFTGHAIRLDLRTNVSNEAIYQCETQACMTGVRLRTHSVERLESLLPFIRRQPVARIRDGELEAMVAQLRFHANGRTSVIEGVLHEIKRNLSQRIGWQHTRFCRVQLENDSFVVRRRGSYDVIRNDTL